jgi:glycerol-3-phosphate dehydrogenase (NAD(P)+)
MKNNKNKRKVKKSGKSKKRNSYKVDLSGIRNIAIIGAGAFGTSIARTIAENHPEFGIKLWSYEKEVAESINSAHLNNLYLPGVELPASISAVTNIRDAVKKCQVLIFATPSKVLYDISLRVKKYIPDNAYIGYLTKGFCRINNQILPMSKALTALFPLHKNLITAVYGPSHAEEVSRNFHTCLNVASKSSIARKIFANMLNCDYITCIETDDIIGVDLGTTLKNPAAIAAGILSVLPNCGDNLMGALISEALGEMLKFAKAFNAREETILGISGLGDLITTALSDHSRNRRFGRDAANQILSSGISFNFFDRLIMIINPEYGFEKMSERFNYLAEGIYVIEPILELAEKHKIPMPVYRSLYEILLNKKDPKLLIETVKNPAKFEEIFERTRIYVTRRKRGLEKKRGGIFKKAILKNILNNFSNSSNLKSELIKYINGFVKDYSAKTEKTKRDADFSQKEYDLLKRIDASNVDKALPDVCKLYIEDIADNFNYLAYKIIIKIIKILNVLYMLLVRSHSELTLENNVKISGSLRRIRKIHNTTNVVYVSTCRSYLDFAYVNLAVDSYGLHVPRFFIERKVLKSRIMKYILKLMGAYVIDSGRLANPIYKETVQNYLATLIEHGVQVLFFPEMNLSKDGEIGEINTEFLSTILTAMYKNSEEISLVPVEVSYYKKPALIDFSGSDTALSVKKILDNRIRINFSEPVFVSDFSNSSDIISMLANNITNKWKSDSYIFPHYVLCRIIKEKNYELNINNAMDYIQEFQQRYNVRKYKTKHIYKKGLDFILKNNIGTIENGFLKIIEKEEINYYSNLIYNLEKVQEVPEVQSA